MSDKELVWVEKEFADKLKLAEGFKAQSEIVDEILSQKKLDMENELRHLEDDMLVFKSVCLNFRKELDKVADAEDEKLEQIINRTCEIHDKVIAQSKEISKSFQPIDQTLHELSGKVEKINRQLDDINTHKMDNFLSIVERVEKMDEGSKKMLKFLMDRYND